MKNENSHCSQGPVSTLPGAFSHTDRMCDDHPRRKAVKRVQGETDSMGCEYFHACEECFGKLKYPLRTSGHCSWCKTPSDDLRNRRDPDEGPAGPVYRVCGPCIVKDNKSFAEEFADSQENDEYVDTYSSSYLE